MRKSALGAPAKKESKPKCTAIGSSHNTRWNRKHPKKLSRGQGK